MRLARLASDQESRDKPEHKSRVEFLSMSRTSACQVHVKLVGGDYGRLQGRPESCLSKPRYRHNRTDRAEANRSGSAAVLHSAAGRNQFVGSGSSFECQRSRVASSDYISRMRYAL